MTKILAHRGKWDGAFPNTLQAMERALTEGFGLEIDVHRSRDGNLFISHDDTVVGKQGITATISKSSAEDVRKIRFSENQGIPELKEAIALYQRMATEVPVAAHIKDENEGDVAENVCAELVKAGVQKRWFIFDVTLEKAQKLKDNFPEISIGISVGEKQYGPTIYLLDQVLDLSFVDIIWADEWKEELYTQQFFRRIKESGKAVWVISPELHAEHGHPLAKAGFQATWEKVLRWGAAGICTDHPETLQQLIKDKHL